MTIDDSLAERINIEMYRRGWDLTELGNRLKGTGIHHNTLVKILSPHPGQPRRKMTVAELCSFATVLKISAEELLSDTAGIAERLRRERIRALVGELQQIVSPPVTSVSSDPGLQWVPLDD